MSAGDGTLMLTVFARSWRLVIRIYPSNGDMFCHTSVQTICHCIETVFGPRWSPDINTPSGLFVRRCLHCGLKLQLLPLHTLVLVGLHLSCSGCKNESLFGILSCLLCLLSNGANPLVKANICVQVLLGSEESEKCSHEAVDPAELAEKVPTGFISTWSAEINTGWQVICNVIRRSQAEWKDRPSGRRPASDERNHNENFDTFIKYTGDHLSTDGNMNTDVNISRTYRLPTDCPGSYSHKNFFGGDKSLSSLWAAVQTELLTYRRLEEGDKCMSLNFNMYTLNEDLISRGEVDIALVQKKMMKPYCECGEFPQTVPACPAVDDAAAYYFSNLDDWNRNSFIDSPEWRDDG